MEVIRDESEGEVTTSFGKSRYLRRRSTELDADPADRPTREKGRRKIVGGKCWRCGALLKDIPTDRNGAWLFTYCTDEDCQAFNTASDALMHWGKLQGGGVVI